MATVRKRTTSKGKTRYQVEVRLKGSPPLRNTFARKAAAREWASRIESEIRAGRLLPRLEAEKHTVSEAIERFRRERAGDYATNWRNQNRMLTWWEKRQGSVVLGQLTPAMITEALMKQGCSGPTRNRYLAVISVVLQAAVNEWMWLGENPARRVRRAKEHRGRMRFLSEDERDRLLEACRESEEPRLYPLVLFALATGARRGELLGLRWQDVQLSADPPYALLDKTKNRDRRALSFPEPAEGVLRDLARTPHISGFLFHCPTYRDGAPKFPRKPWQRALAAAEIEDFRFHDLRHTAASYLAMSGATLAEIAAFLGHRTLAMVKRYAHLTEQHSAAVAKRMADRFLAEVPRA